MAGIPMVSANFFSLEEVILNLLNNARDAIEEATTKGLPNHPEIRVCTACQGNQVELQVCDSGIGIRPEIMGRLFEPFFTTKDTARGTGLGLPICRAILEDFHGTIEIESTPGHGAVARIRLPAMDGYF
jgi:signal transduction histidine kinase